MNINIDIIYNTYCVQIHSYMYIGKTQPITSMPAVAHINII